VVKTDAKQDPILNVVAGLRALLGGWLISPLAGASTINRTDSALRRSSCPSSARSFWWNCQFDASRQSGDFFHDSTLFHV